MNVSGAHFLQPCLKNKYGDTHDFKNKKYVFLLMRKKWAKLYVRYFGKFYDQRRWKFYRTLLRNGRQGEISI